MFMVKRIEITGFIPLWHTVPVLDVRSPSEYDQGHIPGAVNLPLFDDAERKKVGTTYGREGKFESIQVGLDLAGPKLSGFTRKASGIARQNSLLVYCWRGGMRSAAMAWLLDMAGMDVFVLEGGYKSYRTYVRNRFSDPVHIVVLGGKTGSGKTAILHEIARSGNQVLDLEHIASHKGSAFGSLGMPAQPTNEQFENNLYDAWRKFETGKPIWMEDESIAIGSVRIPDPLFSQMTMSPLIEVEVPGDLRVERLVKEYALFPPDQLIESISHLLRKLGGEQTKKAIKAVQEGRFSEAAAILLFYYDNAYTKNLHQRSGQQRIVTLRLDHDDPVANAKKVMDLCHSVLI